MSKNLPLYAFAFLLVSASVSQEPVDRQKVLAAAERIAKQQEQLASEVQALMKMLGMKGSLEGLTPMNAPEGATQGVKDKTAQGIGEYHKSRYESAKESFQSAWEDAPNAVFTNYNLGLVYDRLSKVALAKKMFKTVLDLDKNVAGADKIRKFLDDRPPTSTVVEGDEAPELKEARTEMINLAKQVDSYLSNKTLPVSKRMTATANHLKEMVDTAAPYDKLVQEYYVDIAEKYAAFELYDTAMNLLGKYEKSMHGRVLPDGYHSTLLEVTEKQKNLDKTLKRYRDNEPGTDVVRKLTRDMKELEVFAKEIDSFVKTLNADDADFAKVCQRLKEYRWGDKPDRHVIVVNRFQELLYSSLPGTLSLDRYEDDKGEKFFKNITLLTDKLSSSGPQFVDVTLNVNGTLVPYVVMYSYIPKHQSFVIVRLPKRDLS